MPLGMELGLEVRGLALLLVVCGNFSLQLYCLIASGYLFIYLFVIFMFASRYGQNYFVKFFFKGPSCLFWVKLVDWA